tara:strand:+ start:275 stop:1321 length:1047 start_codon:yes stop_codon:yes gene_type:complete
VNKVRLIVGITGCNRLYYTRALLTSLASFKQSYSNKIEIIVVYIDNGSSEPGLTQYLKDSQVIDELTLNEDRDTSQDVWRGKNQLIRRALASSGWIDPKKRKTNVLLMLQDDVQIVNIHALYKSVIDFYRFNMNYMSVQSVRRTTLESNINKKISPNTSPTTGAKYWLSMNRHLGTTGLFNPAVFDKIGLYPVEEEYRKFEGFTNCEDWMTARAAQSGIIDVVTIPHVASMSSIWNDPRGMHCLVKHDRRCGHYIPANSEDDLYYEMLSDEENLVLESFPIPISFNETTRPIGWELSRDENGDMMKFDRSRIILEGPFHNFDGTPWKPRPEDNKEEDIHDWHDSKIVE